MRRVLNQTLSACVLIFEHRNATVDLFQLQCHHHFLWVCRVRRRAFFIIDQYRQMINAHLQQFDFGIVLRINQQRLRQFGAKDFEFIFLVSS